MDSISSVEVAEKNKKVLRASKINNQKTSVKYKSAHEERFMLETISQFFAYFRTKFPIFELLIPQALTLEEKTMGQASKELTWLLIKNEFEPGVIRARSTTCWDSKKYLRENNLKSDDNTEQNISVLALARMEFVISGLSGSIREDFESLFSGIVYNTDAVKYFRRVMRKIKTKDYMKLGLSTKSEEKKAFELLEKASLYSEMLGIY
ncbi:uncharacterized protein PHALS_00242 [Plasmopara halstedii]|uniref:Uncharacterized protein n=1 Tax=Plasmopara halstedii TaxID=4781 RepID=A0A0P1A6W1_PLAHL|nr:uncharacterized protein PHALS_00242 [Plasmopara halstedii]CEG35917.1 hypothetical protein PHALS_00242 [Plasmopara halstedii]|eukprot:XP_024572286.1 hypothetical protein PHALS_00242 [Plasmopara halstedii]